MSKLPVNKKQKTNYCTMYIVRHGQTQWNVEKRSQGHQHNPLNDVGRSQAAQAAKLFSAIHFDAIYSSDLARAHETAEIITAERDIEVKLSKALRERSLGRIEGRTRQERETIDELRVALDYHYNLPYDKRWGHKIFPEAESDEDVETRFITELRAIAVANPGKIVLVVTHGRPMRLLLVALGAKPKDFPDKGEIANTGYFKIRSDGIDFFVDEVIGLERKQ